MEWQLNVPLYVFPTMQRSAKPVAHTMETGIFTVTVHGPLKRRNNLSSTTVFSLWLWLEVVHNAYRGS